MTRLIDADKLYPDRMTKNGTLAISQNQIANAPTVERQLGECKTCSHRDPEDKKCDCGGLERVGCQFPVSDNYYCKYYERRTWDAEEVDNEQS